MSVRLLDCHIALQYCDGINLDFQPLGNKDSNKLPGFRNSPDVYKLSLTICEYAYINFDSFKSQRALRLRTCLQGVGGPQVGEVTHLAVVEKWNGFTCSLITRGAGVWFR